MREFTCLIIFMVVSALFALLMVIAGFICQYKKQSLVKDSVYECGIIPCGDARIKFDIKYFNYAILFLIFDVETIFLYPFAVSVNSLGLFAVIEAFIFLTILLLGLFFVLRRNLLRWR
ncbi:MAG: NADH-quinone oxidoreductase subunit A [bacterium]|nr:NADH-quinone oxidoreductase subunit A [bacterium]